MHLIRFHHAGQFTKCEGLIQLEGDRLRLEYERRDNLFGIWKSGVKEIFIPVSALVSAKLSCGWFGCTRIVLQASSLEAVRDVPGMSQGRVELKIPHGDREAARVLVEGLCKPAMTSGLGLYD
jgi:hypothetical protein